MLVADGGLATELEARGHDLSDDLWSARLLFEAPDEIVAAHAAFYRAGPAIATTASYQASFDGFAAGGISRDDAERLMRRSVELAAAARDEVGGDDRWVAASVGPYGAALANGEEYSRPIRAFRRGARGLASASAGDPGRRGADVLAIETVPDIDEAEALVGLVQSARGACVAELHDRRSQTRAGQPLAEAFAVADVPEIVAVGVNCCAPGDVLPAIQIAREVTDKPVIVYPEQRRGVGPALGRSGSARRGGRPSWPVAVGGRRRTHRRRLLSGDARRHRSAGGESARPTRLCGLCIGGGALSST